MDNITPLVHGTDSQPVITLNVIQHLSYKTNAIEIQDPEGECLEIVGHRIKKDVEESSAYKLRDELYLVGSLFSQINHSIELPKEAVSGLADLFFRMQDVCDVNVK